MKRKDLVRLLKDNPNKVIHINSGVIDLFPSVWQSSNYRVFSKGGVPTMTAIEEGLKSVGDHEYMILSNLSPLPNYQSPNWLLTAWNERGS